MPVGGWLRSQVALRLLPRLRTHQLLYHLAQQAAPTNTPISGTCQAVTWIDLDNATAVGNSITKVSGGYAWNAGAVTDQAITYGDGYVQVTANNTTDIKMFGLGNGDTSSSYTDIEYAIYMYNDGSSYIYESGNYIGRFDSFSTGDTFKVAVEGGVVKYFHSSSNTPRRYHRVTRCCLTPLSTTLAAQYRTRYFAATSVQPLQPPPTRRSRAHQPTQAHLTPVG